MKKSTLPFTFLTGQRRRPAFAIALAALSVLLTGCTSNYSYDTLYAETAAAAMPADGGFYYESDNGGNNYKSVEEGYFDYEMAPQQATSEETYAIDTTDHETPSVAAPNADSMPLERKLIRNITIEVETTDFEALLSSIKETTAQMDGYVEQSDIYGNSITQYGRPSKRYAYLTLRIPAKALDPFISHVETDSNITFRSESVSDVTLQYSDVQSRLKTLRMEQERLWELMEKADSTEAIVILEERLTEVSSEIESYESRLRYLDNSVTYSTVSLTISEVDLESPTKPENAWQQIQRGFAQNLNALGRSLTAFFISLLSNLPTILFDLLILFLLFFVLRFLFRRIKKGQNTRKKWPFSKQKKPAEPEKTDSEAAFTDHTDEENSP